MQFSKGGWLCSYNGKGPFLAPKNFEDRAKRVHAKKGTSNNLLISDKILFR